MSRVAQHQDNKALHLTTYASLVPRFTPAAGKLGRCACARDLAVAHYPVIENNRDMRHVSVGLAVTAMLIIGGCGSSETDSTDSEMQHGSAQTDATNTVKWQEFSSENGEFSLLMPGTPQLKKSVIQTPLGPLDQYIFLLKAKQGKRATAYMISYADYPPGHTQKFDSNDFLEKTWQGANGDIGDRLIYKKIVTLNNFAGLEFQQRGSGTSNFVITSRNYLVNDRVYQLSAFIPKDLVSQGDAQKFLDSFRLLK